MYHVSIELYKHEWKFGRTRNAVGTRVAGECFHGFFHTLLHRLQFTFGVTGKVLSWFSSYLSGRSQQIAINDTLSAEFELHCGVPQGSCLGPLLFTLYWSKFFKIIKQHFPMVHCYADDTQVYISF